MFILKTILTWKGEYKSNCWIPRGALLPPHAHHTLGINSSVVIRISSPEIAEFNEVDVALADRIGKTEIIRELLCLNY